MEKEGRQQPDLVLRASLPQWLRTVSIAPLCAFRLDDDAVELVTAAGWVGQSKPDMTVAFLAHTFAHHFGVPFGAHKRINYHAFLARASKLQDECAGMQARSARDLES